MYMTRYLSHYMTSPEALYDPPEGPNSGYLVIQDEESETYSCFGLCKDRYLGELPFPQNKILTTRYSSGSGKHRRDSYDEVVFIPVLNQPLSSNRYYAIKPHGSHKGEEFTSSKEEDMGQCCFSNYVRDVKPRPLDTHDMYQQFEILPYETISCDGGGSFYAKSLANDGYPPDFLRRKGWQIYSGTPKNYELREAKGINASLRSRLPNSNFPPSTKTSNSVVVGKWYCPFVFIKEGRLRDQVKRSIFYEMTLEQRWEQVFTQKYEHTNEDVVSVNATFLSETVFIGENLVQAIWSENNVVDGAIWFTCFGGDNTIDETVGLNLEIIERMRWEEQKVGWVGGGDKKIQRVRKEEKFDGINGWNRFSCYILVERFVLKRMDGSVVLTYDFGHSHQTKSIFD